MTTKSASSIEKCLACRGPGHKIIGFSDDHEYRSSSVRYGYMRCIDCGTIKINPSPTQQALIASYPSHYYSFHMIENFKKYRGTFWGGKHYSGYQTAVFADARRLASELGEEDPLKLKILDYGAGDGFRLQLLSKMGFEKPNLTAYEAFAPAETNILKPFQCIFGRDALRKVMDQFDLIYASHVIEHLEDPSILFEDLRRLMKKRSKLIVDMPVPEGPHFNITKRQHWGGYHTPRHLNILTVDGLCRLALASKMEVESTQYLDDSWIIAQTINSLMQIIPRAIVPNVLRRTFEAPTKEEPTFARAAIFGVLAFASKTQLLISKKSSVVRIVIRRSENT